MKDVRPQFKDEDFLLLQEEARRLGVSLKQLVHDRALCIDTENTTINAARLLANEMSLIREVINQIIQRETHAEKHLYEDDVIRLELALAKLETVVTNFISTVLRRK